MDRGRAPNGIGHLMILVMLLWHVLNFIALWSPIVLQQNEISIEFELWWKYDKYPKVNGAQVP